MAVSFQLSAVSNQTNMPYCPTCKAEYREGVETCADCGAELSPSSPPNDESLLWTPLSSKRTVFEVALIALGAAIASAMAATMVAAVNWADEPVDYNISPFWQVFRVTALLLAFLGTAPIIGYVHARLLKRRMNVRPVLLAWVMGMLPLAVLYGVVVGKELIALAAIGCTLLQAALGAAGTMLGCRVGLALHNR